MLAFFGSLAPFEVGLILVAAILIFGRDLPRVAAQVFAQLAKIKRAMREMWRETGMEEEMRRVRNELDEAKLALPTAESLDPRTKARELVQSLDAEVRKAPRPKDTGDEDAAEGQAAEPPLSQEELRRRAEEAEAEASRRAAQAQAKMQAKRNRPAEPEGEANRRSS